MLRFLGGDDMRGTFIVVTCIVMCFLGACSEEKLTDVSSDPTYKNVIGAEYEVVGPLLAYGIRDHSRAPVELVTLIPPPGIEGSEVGFRVPVAIGSKVTIRRVFKTNRVFDPPMTLVVQLEGTQLPVDTMIRIDLFRGNEGKGNVDLNASIYRPVYAKR